MSLVVYRGGSSSNNDKTVATVKKREKITTTEAIVSTTTKHHNVAYSSGKKDKNKTSSSDEFNSVYDILKAFEYDKNTKGCDKHCLPAMVVTLTNNLYKPLHRSVTAFQLYVKTISGSKASTAISVSELLRGYFDIVFNKETLDFCTDFPTVNCLLEAESSFYTPQ